VADQAKVDVQDRPVAPVIEEVFSQSLDPLQVQPVQEGCQSRVAALRRRDADHVARQVALVVQRQAMDGVAFGHSARLA
jgi:hypothetical protein